MCNTSMMDQNNSAEGHLAVGKMLVDGGADISSVNTRAYQSSLPGAHSWYMLIIKRLHATNNGRYWLPLCDTTDIDNMD